MDYTKAYMESTRDPSTRRENETKQKVFVNTCCPLCKSKEVIGFTDDGGSKLRCKCGHQYVCFIWTNTISG